MKIGILALQGAFSEHRLVLDRIGIESREVRLPAEIDGLDGLIIPGGESTTILKLMHDFEIFEPLRIRINAGLAVWGTCAGMICLAKKVLNSEQSVLQPLSVMDITVRRNAFGRQVDSFEADVEFNGLGAKPFHAVFIRAPLIEEVKSPAAVLARLPDGTIVAARQRKLLVTSFHPELTDDTRVHEYFLEMAKD